ncbi:MAG: hypothetical protein FWB95_03230 [Treponema sp.]|nr:hypothetical protein [Treponema sp.]
MILLLSSVSLFAQQPIAPPWWLSLETGKQNFRAGDFGSALMLFEDARRDRRAMYEQMERDVITLLSINEVRRIGDSLERVERYAKDRHYNAATAAFNELYYRVPRAGFNNSALSALAAFDRLKNYPEAEYWIGEVYRVEGELQLALSQFKKAYSMRGIADDPGFGTSLRYKIAGIHNIKQEYTEMIDVYLSIINESDTLWASSAINGDSGAPVSDAQAAASFARSAMTRTLSEHGINRFLELYRYNNSIVEPAHRLLGFYFAPRSRPSAEQHLMFSFLIQNTKIIEEVRRRTFDFVFTDLSSLAQEIYRNPLLLSYIDEVEYFRTIYYFGVSLYWNGKTSSGRSLWEFLASQPQAGEWNSRAVMQIRNPHPEPLIEAPRS